MKRIYNNTTCFISNVLRKLVNAEFCYLTPVENRVNRLY